LPFIQFNFIIGFMSEKLGETPEFEPVTAIAQVLKEWLQTEIDSTMRPNSRNSYLNDWERFRKDLQFPFEDSRNQNAGKARSHYDRLLGWTLDSEKYPSLITDDYYLARQIFCAQMFVSGAYRRQCFFQAANTSDYVRRRQSEGPTDIDLEKVVEARYDRAQNVLNKNAPWSRLQQTTLEVNEEALEAAKLVHELGSASLERESSTVVNVLRDQQSRWVGLAVDYTVFAADRPNSGWENVPFLEAKSITEEPAIYYPFKPVIGN
jgi:hypothetical protein